MKKSYKLKSVIMAIGVCAFMVTTANAGDGTTPGLSGFYGVVSAGYAKYDTDTTGLSITTEDDTDTGYSIGIGYEFNKYLSFEAGYLDLGETSIGSSAASSGTLYGKPYTFTGTLTATAETDGYYIGPIVSLPFSDKCEAYAKIGVYVWDLDADATATGTLTYDSVVYAGSVQASASDDGTDLYYGLGTSYDITDKFTVRADWTRYDIESDDVDLFAVGAVFKFGKLL